MLASFTIRISFWWLLQILDHNLHPLILRKELISVKTIRATAGKEKRKTEISKPSRFRQIPPSNQQKTTTEALKNIPPAPQMPSGVAAGRSEGEVVIRHE